MTDGGRFSNLRDFSASARLRIIAWMLLLTVLGLLSAGMAVLVVESARIDHRADRNIAQEFEELDRLVSDPGERLDSVNELLEEALRRNVAQQYEIYLGIVEGEVRYVSYGPGGTASDDLASDDDFVAAITALPRGGFGSVDTERGEVRFGVRPVLQGDVEAAYVVAYLTDPWRGEFVSVMQGYALVAILTVLIVALGGWLVAGRILRPVHDLEVTARDITESDLSGRILVSGKDGDVSRLARTFNSMLDRVAGAFDSQRRFLDDAGHELATPITIVQGHLELLDAHDPQEVEETRVLLLDELDRMNRLTRDLVTLAKAERPDFVRLEACDTARLTEQALRLAEGLGDRTWRLDGCAEGEVPLDQQRVVQAVLQLAANAVRYTEEHAEIAVGSALVEDHFDIWVRDTGPGVATEEQGAIFERFSRGASARDTEGSGLGLTIVCAIAEAHGGTVDLESVPGAGARFTLRIPAPRSRRESRTVGAPASPVLNPDRDSATPPGHG